MGGRLVCNEYGADGPTGRFREVAVVAVVDAGGNVLGRASTVKGAKRAQEKWRIHTSLRAVVAGGVIEPLPGDVLVGG